ncbi:MAG: DUF1049 domain-containing protein [Moraxellaceae bacterium]|nr:DUF1049 domain-containing protein [Moraxellaceae bacterium]
MRALLSVIVLAIVVALALTLGAENGVSVRFNYLLAQGEFRLSSLMVAWFFAGLAIGFAMCGSVLIRSRMQLRALRKKYAAQVVVLSRLQAMPVAPESSVKD